MNQWRQTTEESRTMKVNTKADAEGEVRGIVILRGSSARIEPRLSLYMWCDSPDAEPDSTTRAA